MSHPSLGWGLHFPICTTAGLASIGLLAQTPPCSQPLCCLFPQQEWRCLAGRDGLGPPEPSWSGREKAWEYPLGVGEPTFFVQPPILGHLFPPPLQVARQPALLHPSWNRCSQPPSQWLATSMRSASGTCMFPLYSPHLFHASPTSSKREPIFAPADRLPLSPPPPSLSGVAVEKPEVFCTFSTGQTLV